MFTNYRYYTDGKRKVVAISTYAGKPVRGVAICAPEDTFDLEQGKRLAAARCNMKVAIKRVKNAQKKLDCVKELRAEIEKVYNDMMAYQADAATAYKEACLEITNCTENI